MVEVLVAESRAEGSVLDSRSVRELSKAVSMSRKGRYLQPSAVLASPLVASAPLSLRRFDGRGESSAVAAS